MSAGTITFAPPYHFTFSYLAMDGVMQPQADCEPIEKRPINACKKGDWFCVRIMEDLSSGQVIQVWFPKGYKIDSWHLAKMCRLIIQGFPHVLFPSEPLALAATPSTPPPSRPETPAEAKLAELPSYLAGLDDLLEGQLTTLLEER